MYPFLLTLIVVLSSKANAASFNCSKASTHVEKMICSDAELSSLDDQLNVAYKAALNQADANGKAGLKYDQRDWLKWINRPTTLDCSDYEAKPPVLQKGKPCIEKAYRVRIEALTSGCVEDKTSTLEDMAKWESPWSTNVPKGFAIDKTIGFYVNKPNNWMVMSYNLPATDLAAAKRAAAGEKGEYKEIAWCRVTGPDGKSWLAGRDYAGGFLSYVQESERELVP